MFMYMKLGLQQRISACHAAMPRTLARYALASALRLYGCALAIVCFTLLKIQASSHFMYMNFTTQNIDAL